MFNKLLAFLPPEAVKLALVLFLSFLIGLEREELKRDGRRTFGGVRTFPLIALVGYVVALLSNGQILPLLLGFVVVGGFMLMSYWHKLNFSTDAGVTTEISGLVVYLVGALVHLDHFWFACTLVVVSLLLLELKDGLEGITERMAPDEIITITKFLLLTGVILPIVPNQDFGLFHINPFKTWLVVVAVSGVSYASYVLMRMAKGRGGIFLSAVLGGLYSATVTTVVLAKRAASGRHPHVFSGSILAASGLMYFRVLVLVWLFNRALAARLAPAFLILSVVPLVAGWLWTRRPDGEGTESPETTAPHNPLELRAAVLFAAMFLVVLVITQLSVQFLGKTGIYGLAALMGLTDVVPFVMGLTHSVGLTTPLPMALIGITLATASNNLVKGVYAYFFARGTAGRWSFCFLAGLALAGLLPLCWI